jgi:hypothetical protein
VVGLLAIPLWYFGSPDRDWRVLLTILGGLISGSLIVQKQNLDELRLLHDLFKDFNARYDKINAALQRIAEHGIDDRARDTELIVEYFNLCAEEYWWFSARHIPDEIWGSWCRGMLSYLDQPLFADLWSKEVKSDSYYGLTLDVIRRGAVGG